MEKKNKRSCPKGDCGASRSPVAVRSFNQMRAVFLMVSENGDVRIRA